ncbi:hypothetical protein CYMTET_45050 [Cymbomonas tetramitiformis]|uniref:Uncharacterized protein n=1 Tax=Cymbomonas tetramitiformis TaxID=36881 RepID=A0AAE0EYQ1_9CHLO|nr:hypothetical protein CYMTET_45050 [Cymbomonas tetramitiformis]|eukprot:gene22486-27135_t
MAEQELSEAAKHQSTVKLLEAAEKGLLDVAKDLIEEKPENINFQQEETGHTALHKASLSGQLEVVQTLLAAGADPNLDDADLNTCLHIAAATYASDETGDFAFEDVICALVDGGAISLRNRKKLLPEAGEDAATKVQSRLETAERKGKTEAAKRDKERRDRGMQAFGDAMSKFLDDRPCCLGNVAE